jgi:hypothetical protein
MGHQLCQQNVRAVLFDFKPRKFHKIRCKFVGECFRISVQNLQLDQNAFAHSKQKAYLDSSHLFWGVNWVE